MGTRLSLAALAEYQGGHRGIGDGAAYFRAARGSVDPRASLAEQARAASVPAIAEATLERADFVRLREVSAAWRLRDARTTVTVAGRNLLTATGYGGRDPEAAGTADLAGLYTVPVARTVAVRVGTRW